MKHTQFLHTVLPATPGAYAKNTFAATDQAVRPPIARTPKYLQPGDTIAITCPADPLDASEVQNCITALQSWGFKVKIGHTVGNRWQPFGGTDETRAADLQVYLDDENVSAILFGRGGYAVMRIIDKINWEKFMANPKWLIGFNDITAIHCHVNALYKIPTMHAPMAVNFSAQPNDSAESIRQALTGEPIQYRFAGNKYNVSGQTIAELVGGNLSMIYAMQGSGSELKTDGKILFIEDVSESKYNIDRMLLSLKRSGKLEKLAALIVGGITGSGADSETGYTERMEELVYEKVKEYGFPVCFHFPAGHQRLNLALKLGLPYKLTVDKAFCSLSEMPLPKVSSLIKYGNDSPSISRAMNSYSALAV